MTIFPIVSKAYTQFRQDGSTAFTSSDCNFRMIFDINRPKNISWYAYDVIIHSRTKIEYIIYDRRDSRTQDYWTIGKELYRFEVEDHGVDISEYIEKAINEMSVDMYEQELLDARKKRILEIREQIKKDCENELT